MGWKENRRRKRVWYRHYRSLALQLKALMTSDRGSEFAPEAILFLVYDMYERRRLHGKRFVALSAMESLLLACQDTELGSYSLTPRVHTRRPPMRGAPPGQARTTQTRPSARPAAQYERIELGPPVYDRGFQLSGAAAIGPMPPREDVPVMPELPPAAMAQLMGEEAESDEERDRRRNQDDIPF